MSNILSVSYMLKLLYYTEVQSFRDVIVSYKYQRLTLSPNFLFELLSNPLGFP